MLVPYNLIGSLALTVGLVAQGQDLPFDKQILLPPTGLSTVRPIPPVRISDPDAASTPRAPMMLDSPVEAGTLPPAPLAMKVGPHTVYPYVTQDPRTGSTGGPFWAEPSIGTVPTAPQGRIWTWDRIELRDYANAAKSYRDKLRQGLAPGMQHEFEYFAAPGYWMAPYSVFSGRTPLGGFELFKDKQGQFYFVMPSDKSGTFKQWTEPNFSFKPGERFELPKDWKGPFFFKPGDGNQLFSAPKPQLYFSQKNPYVFMDPRSSQLRVDIDSRGGELFKTLTPHQRELQKQRGYLRFQDLTPEQREILTHPKGSFEMDYHDGRQDLIIKN